MGCKMEKFQLVLKANQGDRDIALHLENGETIKLTFLHTEVFDMANGTTLVVGRAVDQDSTSFNDVGLNISEETSWKQ